MKSKIKTIKWTCPVCKWTGETLDSFFFVCPWCSKTLEKPLHSTGGKVAEKKNKYNAQRTAGRASKIEAQREGELQILEKAGLITDLSAQPTYRPTKAQISYKPDFKYYEDGREVAEEVKGPVTDRFRLICKLWKHYGPCELRVVVRGPNQSIVMSKKLSVMPTQMEDD